MDSSESRNETIILGCMSVASIALFVWVYSPLLWLPPNRSIRPMTCLSLCSIVFPAAFWIICLGMGVRQLFVKPRRYGLISIGIGVLQLATFVFLEWWLIRSRGHAWGS
jgi:hypothetical protein